MIKRLLSAPKRLLTNRLRKRRLRATLIYIDTQPPPPKGNKAIADLEYVEIYEDPYLFKQ